jgi:sRNA-binding carbon storage regulator CsrA
MLILTRGLGEAVWILELEEGEPVPTSPRIGKDIRIVVQAFNAPRPDGGMTIKIGVDAPDTMKILREELLDRPSNQR